MPEFQFGSGIQWKKLEDATVGRGMEHEQISYAY
jgi:hypothetical protein